MYLLLITQVIFVTALKPLLALNTTDLELKNWTTGKMITLEDEAGIAVKFAWKEFDASDPMYFGVNVSNTKTPLVYKLCEAACQSIEMELVGMEYITILRYNFEFLWFMTNASEGTKAYLPVIDIAKNCYLAEIDYDWHLPRESLDKTILQKCSSTTALQLLLNNSNFLLACQSAPYEEKQMPIQLSRVVHKTPQEYGLILGLGLIAATLLVIVICLLCAMRCIKLHPEKPIPIQNSINNTVNSDRSLCVVSTPSRIINPSLSTICTLHRRTPPAGKDPSCARINWVASPKPA